MTTIANEVLDRVGVHPGGECKCGTYHISEGTKGGYSKCRVCRKLRADKGKPRRPVDGFERLRARRGIVVDHRLEAVTFLRRWMSREERTQVRLKVEPHEGSLMVDICARVGSRSIRALRAAGFNERDIGLDCPFEAENNIALLLCEAVGKAGT